MSGQARPAMTIKGFLAWQTRQDRLYEKASTEKLRCATCWLACHCEPLRSNPGVTSSALRILPWIAWRELAMTYYPSHVSSYFPHIFVIAVGRIFIRLLAAAATRGG
jgi:hypothetical protein